VPQNGKKNETLGVYKSDCCGAEIVIGKGAIFPKCPDHPRSITIWKLVPDEKTETKKSASEPAA